MSMQSRQTKKSYIKHSEGSFPLGKSSCQQAMSMEIAKKSARASALYECYLRLHCSEPVTFHEYPELNLAKLTVNALQKGNLYTTFPICLFCFDLQHLKTQCASGCRALQPKDWSVQEPEQLSTPAQVPDPF